MLSTLFISPMERVILVGKGTNLWWVIDSHRNDMQIKFIFFFFLFKWFQSQYLIWWIYQLILFKTLVWIICGHKMPFVRNPESRFIATFINLLSWFLINVIFSQQLAWILFKMFHEHHLWSLSLIFCLFFHFFFWQI